MTSFDSIPAKDAAVEDERESCVLCEDVSVLIFAADYLIDKSRIMFSIGQHATICFIPQNFAWAYVRYRTEARPNEVYHPKAGELRVD